MEPHSPSRSPNVVGWLGLAIAALTLVSAFVVPEVRRKILGLSDPPVEVRVDLQDRTQTSSRDVADDAPTRTGEGLASEDTPAVVLETTTSSPPPTDTFAAQLNDILTQADPVAMRRRLSIDEGSLFTVGGVIDRIDSQQITVRTASGRMSFAYDSSTLLYSDAVRASGDQLRVGDRVYVQWYRRRDGVAALYTIRVTHIF